MIGEFDMTIVADGDADSVRGSQYLYFIKPRSVTITSKAGGSLKPTVDRVSIYLTDESARQLARDIVREDRRKRRLGL